MNPDEAWAELLRLVREHAAAGAPFHRFPLDRAALLLAADAYPGLDPAPYEARLDAYAGRVENALGASEADPRVRLGALRKVLFEEEGFHGNREEYYDPRNSYLNWVLDRKLGIPISLAAVMLGVSRRLEWPLWAVNFPAHVLVRYEGAGEALAVDPFHGGLILGREELEERWRFATGTDAPHPEAMLRPAESRQVVARMLNNLRVIHHARGELARASQLGAQMVAVMDA